MADRQLDLSADGGPVGGDYSTAAERFNAAFDETRLNEGRLQFSEKARRAYAADAAMVKEMTGQDLANPYDVNVRQHRDDIRRGYKGNAFDVYMAKRTAALAQYPTMAPDDAGSQHPLAGLYAEQRRVEGVAADAIDRSPSAINAWFLGKIDPVALAGGLAASVTDPMLLAQNTAGLGTKTWQGLSGLAWGAFKASVSNAAVTAVTQPMVQTWRKDAGLDYGWGQAAGNVAGAAIFGAILDPAFRGVYRGGQRIAGRVPIIDEKGYVTGYRAADTSAAPGAPATASAAPAIAERPPIVPDNPEHALDLAAQRHPENTVLRRAADGDPVAIEQAIRDSGIAETDPAMRGAVAELERFKLFGKRPETPDWHDTEAFADMIRRSIDPDAPPVGVTERVAGPHGDPAALSPEAQSARQRLVDQSGDPLDMARIMRERPDLVTSDLPLSDHKMRQARLLAALSDDAFDRVAAGEIAPNHATLIARHVADKARHGEAVDAIKRAGRMNADEVRLLLAELHAKPGNAAPHLAMAGAVRAAPEFDALRIKALDGATKAMLKEPRIIAAIEAEAKRAEVADPRMKAGDKRIRTAVGRMLQDAVAELARGDTHVAEIIADAAAQRERGISARMANDAAAARIAAAYEAGGIEALKTPRRVAASDVRGFSDPMGPEAKAQVEAYEASRPKRSDVRGQAANDAGSGDQVMRDVRAAARAESYADPVTGNPMTRGDIDTIIDMAQFVADMRKMPMPESLSSWVIKNGRLKDAGGEIGNILGGKNRHLLSGNGMPLDRATLRAWETGFLPSAERPTIDVFLAALAEDVSGNRVIRAADAGIMDDLRIAREMEAELERIGIKPGATAADVEAAFAKREGAGGAGGRQADTAGAGGSRSASDGFSDQVRFSIRDDRAAKNRGLSAAQAAGGETAGGQGRAGQPGADPAAERRQAARAALALRDPVTSFKIDKELTAHLAVLDGGDALTLQIYVSDGKVRLPRLPGDAIDAIPMLDQVGNWAAKMQMVEQRPGEFEVSLVTVDLFHRRKKVATRLYDALERELGIELKPSGDLLEDGFKYWSARRPESTAFHRYDKRTNMWKSALRLTAELEGMREWSMDKAAPPDVRADALKAVEHYQGLLDTIPDEVKTPEALARMFSLRDPSDLTPRGAKDWGKIRAEVDKVVARLPHRIKVQVARAMTMEGRTIDGFYDPHMALVRLAMGDTAHLVAKHEEIHVLRDLNLMSHQEFQVLVRRGLADGQMERFNIERRYAEAYAERFKDDPVALKAAMHEEMVAEMWAGSRRGERWGGLADEIFRRMTDFREKLGNAVRGLGFQSAEDVFRRIETGEMGARQQVPRSAIAPASKAPKFSIPIVKGVIAVPDHVRELAGIAASRFTIDADYIVKKRTTKDLKWKNATSPLLATPEGVKDFVALVLDKPVFSYLHRDGASVQFLGVMDDGNFGLVAIAKQPDADGSHFIKTAFVQTPERAARVLASIAHESGITALKFGGDRASLKTAEALLSSQAHREPPGHSLHTVVAALRQQAERPDGAGVAMPPHPVETSRALQQQIAELADLASVCKH